MLQSRRTSASRHLDLMGLKFIRMVMASYFIALSVDLIGGVDTSVFFAPFMSEPIAERVGASVVLYCAALLFFGLFLRLTSLYLAIVVLTSSTMENFLHVSGGSLDAFWRDLVIVCGLLLSYCTLSPRDLRMQAFIVSCLPDPILQVTGKVLPRRVSTTGVTTSPRGAAKIGRLPLEAFRFKSKIKAVPLVEDTLDFDAPEPEKDFVSSRNRADDLRRKQNETEDEDDMVNIFAA